MHLRFPALLSRVTLVALLLGIAANAYPDVDVHSLPKPTGYVSDLAHAVSPAEKEQLEEFCTQVEQQLGVQFALVTIDSIGDRPTRDFALDLAREWGVGSKKDNQGVLLLLAIQDRKSDIETGRGIEPYLTDGFSGSTLRAMRPPLRQGQYGAALLAAAQTMAEQIAQGKGIPFSATVQAQRPPPATATHRRSGIPGFLIVLGIFLLFWLLSRAGRSGGGGYRGGGGGGFLSGLLLGSLLNSGRRDDDRWGSGGGFGGGSGGGGGFGGFGGGDFGGGGASSDW
ncbi:MAG: TPM domain-containing protein [Acidobacteriaceae bacterium]|nr:TPM domain-containing protein [Acidobacteriaceae bacterium]